MLGALEVASGRGHLVIRGQIPVPAIRRGLRMYPDGDDPDTFRIELPGFGSGTSQVVFSREPGGEVTAMHLGVQPPSFRKRPGIQNPRSRAAGAFAAGALAIAMARRPATSARAHTDLHARPQLMSEEAVLATRTRRVACACAAMLITEGSPDQPAQPSC